MLPAVVATSAVYGARVWLHLAVAVVVGAAVEVACLRLRRAPLVMARDGSLVITAMIIAVMIPPHAAWWLSAFAVAVALALGKHYYGGLGNNPFNPAMVGYALAFISFPSAFNLWLEVDGVSSPTPLAARRLDETETLPPLAGADIALLAAIAVGGCVLLWKQVADWRLTASFLLGALAMNLIVGDSLITLAYGGLLFAAFFVITDPVTAATTRAARWLLGAAVGALALWLRERGAHTDGIAFAVLFGNIIAPLLDYGVRQWQRRQKEKGRGA